VARPLRFSRNDLAAILEYDRRVFDRYARRIRRLPWTEASRKRGIGHESLFDTLVHILNVHEVWLVYIARGRNSDPVLEPLFEDPTRHPKDWKGFDAYARRVWREVDATVARLTLPALDRRLSAFWMKGRYTTRDAVLQVSLEQAHHLGEIIGALWQDDVRPPEMTWIDTRRDAPRRKRA
jgi:uncharacterized damage-inducible protein DinB